MCFVTRSICNSFSLLVHLHVCVVFFCAPNSLYKCSPHLTATFSHTLWLAPLTAFGNVCLQSLTSIHLENWLIWVQAAVTQLCICSARSHVYGLFICVVLWRSQNCDISPILPSYYCCPPSKPSSSTYDGQSVFSLGYSFHHVCCWISSNFLAYFSVFSCFNVKCFYWLFVPEELWKWWQMESKDRWRNCYRLWK